MIRPSALFVINFGPPDNTKKARVCWVPALPVYPRRPSVEPSVPASSYIHRRAARCDTSDKKAGAGAGSDIGHYVVRAAENDTGCLIVSAAEPKGSPGILSLVAACRRKRGRKKNKKRPPSRNVRRWQDAPMHICEIKCCACGSLEWKPLIALHFPRKVSLRLWKLSGQKLLLEKCEKKSH